jgi:hypothetical protein
MNKTSENRRGKKRENREQCAQILSKRKENIQLRNLGKTFPLKMRI